ncbi:MAG: hypothetical protein AB7L84_16635 [Acidimicrobiia bacterium]
MLVEARHLATLRPAMGALAVTTSRIHFNNESAKQKRRVLDAIAEMPVQVFATVCRKDHDVDEYRARAGCVAEIVRRTQELRVTNLILESRQDDREDVRVITRVRRPCPVLRFEHRPGRQERMLWAADAVTWAVAAGSAWVCRLGAVLTDVVEVRP